MLLKIKQFEIWLANLNPSKGTEPGKIRPVVVLQSDLLNEVNHSTIIASITTNVKPDFKLKQIQLDPNQLDKPSAILVDQIRAIDNQRFISKIGKLTKKQAALLNRNIIHVMDIKI